MSLLLLFNELANGSPQRPIILRSKTAARTIINARLSVGPFTAGDVVDIDFDFVDGQTGDFIDPADAPSIRVQSVDRRGVRSALQTFTYGVDENVVQIEPGRYRASIDVDSAGTWQFTIVSTSSNAKATENGYFEVAPVLGS